jgi:hypothetical protein
MRWIQVDWGDACFQIGTQDGVCVEVPPLVKWGKGKPESLVAGWLKAKGARFTPLPDGATRAASPHQDPAALWYCEQCKGRHTIAGMQWLRERDWTCRAGAMPPR